MSLARLVRELPAGFDLVLADVGSAGGLKDRWRVVRPVVSALLFDPRDGGAVERRGRDTFMPVAVGRTSGTATLNLTALGNMSSTLAPNAALMSSFRKKGAHTAITGSVPLTVEPLDKLAGDFGRPIDVLKVDTQGSELEILRGAEEVLTTSVLLAEIEVSFLERYTGQPLADDIVRHMRERGFELIDLMRAKRYRLLNDSGVGNISTGGGQRSGRIAYADALFVLGDAAFEERLTTATHPAALALKRIVALLIYGKADMASRAFDTVGPLFEPGLARALDACFARLARRNFGPGVLHHLVDYLARRV